MHHGAHDSLAAPCTETRARSDRPSSSIGPRSPPTCAGISSRRQITGLDLDARDGGLAVSRRPLEPDLPAFGSAARSWCCAVRRSVRSRRKAHDMAREYRWLAALHPVFPLAPRPYLLCEDPSVSAAVFYVMERRRGIVVRERGAAAAGRTSRWRGGGSAKRWSTRWPISIAIDVTSGPLADARQADRIRRSPGARLDRAVGTLEAGRRPGDGQRSRSGWRAHPPPDAAASRRSCTATSSSITCCSIRSTPRRLVAVFDWEMSALGDPLVDLGILLAYWTPTAPPSTARRADRR